MNSISLFSAQARCLRQQGEYTDLNNFEIKFTRRLMLVMKNLYESNGLEYLG